MEEVHEGRERGVCVAGSTGCLLQATLCPWQLFCSAKNLIVGIATPPSEHDAGGGELGFIDTARRAEGEGEQLLPVSTWLCCCL